MPCRDGRDEELDALDTKAGHVLRERNAMLCAVLSALGLIELDELLDERINWQEAGVTKEDLVRWWSIHKEEDMERRAALKLRAAALAKLTPEEIAALGVK